MRHGLLWLFERIAYTIRVEYKRSKENSKLNAEREPERACDSSEATHSMEAEAKQNRQTYYGPVDSKNSLLFSSFVSPSSICSQR